MELAAFNALNPQESHLSVRDRLLRIAAEIRAHRKGGAPLSLHAANYLGAMLKCWREDPTARAITFNQWLERNIPLRDVTPRLSAVSICTRFAVAELWPTPDPLTWLVRWLERKLPHFTGTTTQEIPQ